MLIHPTLDRLQALKLTGMQRALIEQMEMPERDSLTFDERFGMLVDAECAERDTRRLKTRLKRARLRQLATVEDIDYRHPRGLDKSLMLSLAGCDWVREHHNCIITGPTGAGKSYLACALGQAACRQHLTVRYVRTSRLLDELTHAHADGSYPKLLHSLARVDLLILDDWMRDTLSAKQTRDLLEVLDDRYGRRSTLLAGQVPVADWHSRFPDPTLADAILDRLVHNAYRLELKGESQRKTRSPLAMVNT